MWLWTTLMARWHTNLILSLHLILDMHLIRHISVLLLPLTCVNSSHLASSVFIIYAPQCKTWHFCAKHWWNTFYCNFLSSTSEATNPPFTSHSNNIFLLQVVERKRTPAEIREEYERLQREREERRLQQRTNPKVCSGKDNQPSVIWCFLYTLLINTVLILECVICRERLAWVLMPQTSLTNMRRTMRIWLEGESHMWKLTRCTYHNP